MRSALLQIAFAIAHTDDAGDNTQILWAKGSLAVYSNFTYSVTYGSTTLSADAPANVTGVQNTTGEGFEEIAFQTADGVLSIRYFDRFDGFYFNRVPSNAQLQLQWPRFNFDPSRLNVTNQCIGWTNRFFYPGGRTSTIQRCATDGPVFLFENSSTSSSAWAHTLALSPINYFTGNAVHFAPPPDEAPDTSHIAAGIPPLICKDPHKCTIGVSASKDYALANTSAVLIARRGGVTRATRALGAQMRRAHNAMRRRGDGVKLLSYWNDNQAGYSWWSVGPDQNVWGQPELIYHKLKRGYDEARIPVRMWEPDNNLAAQFNAKSGWIYNDWKSWNLTLYPSAGNLSKDLGNLPLVLYMNGWAEGNAHMKQYKFKQYNKGQLEVVPADSYAFHHDIFSNAQQWGFKMLFTDFLSFRGGWARGQPVKSQAGPAATAATGSIDDGEHVWLGGMTVAAQDLGVEVQYCMSSAHQLLMSLEWPAVTNVRANGDGGLTVSAFVFSSVLASMTGLGWSKDNLRTADRCYVNGTYPNGTVEFPCDSIHASQFVNGHFQMQRQQTMLAALSLGPVGLSDQLSAHASDPSANITTNKTLAMATCSEGGELLQPSYPLTPLEEVLTGDAGGRQLWATYTSIHNGTSSNDSLFFFTVLAWTASTADSRFTLTEQHLASIVDVDSSGSLASFEDVPQPGFLDSDGRLPATAATRYISWTSDFARQAMQQQPCEGLNMTELPTGTMDGLNLTLPLQLKNKANHIAPTLQVNVAPVFGKLALLGEAGKITAVSTYRFAAVDVSQSGLLVALRGAAGEQVRLLFAHVVDDGFSCTSKTVTIGADGSAVLTVPDAAPAATGQEGK